jgi:tetratricopeptide (TPR) repeat protein
VTRFGVPVVVVVVLLALVAFLWRWQQNRAISESVRESVRQGREYLKKRDFELAAAHFSEALRKKPDDVTILTLRAWALAGKRDGPGAMADAVEALRLNPALADAHFARACAKQASGDSSGAIKDCAEAIRIDENHAQARRLRGVLLSTFQLYGAAIQDLDKAATLDETREDADIFIARARCRVGIKDFAGALADASKALELPERIWPRGDAYYARALAYWNQGKRDLARECLQQAMGAGSGEAGGALLILEEGGRPPDP